MGKTAIVGAGPFNSHDAGSAGRQKCNGDFRSAVVYNLQTYEARSLSTLGRDSLH